MTANEELTHELVPEIRTLDADVLSRKEKLHKLNDKLAELKTDTTSPVDKLAASQTKCEAEIAATTRAIELLTERRTAKLVQVAPLLKSLRTDHAATLRDAEKANQAMGDDLLNDPDLKSAMARVVAAFRYHRDCGCSEPKAGFSNWLAWFGEKLTAEDNDAIMAIYDAHPAITLPEESDALKQLAAFEMGSQSVTTTDSRPAGCSSPGFKIIEFLH